jgi:hypothetical protein
MRRPCGQAGLFFQWNLYPLNRKDTERRILDGSVGSVDEGGNKWWFKMKLNTDDIETARKVILLDKCRPRRY